MIGTFALWATILVASPSPLQAVEEPGASFAQSELTGERVLVVCHGGDDVSKALADLYLRHHGLDAEQRFELPRSTPRALRVSRRIFESHVRDPLATFLKGDPARLERYAVLLLMPGVPWIVPGSERSMDASVDSELTQLFDESLGVDGQIGGIRNPLHETFRGLDALPDEALTHLVFRFDPMASDALEAAAHCLQQGATGTETGAVRLGQLDAVVGADDGETPTLRAHLELELGLEVQDDDEQPVLAAWSPTAATTFSPGGVAVLAGGEGKSSHPDLEPFRRALASGACFVCGTIDGDDIQGRVQPDVFLERFFHGVPAGLAAYQALPQLSRTTVLLGDPLLRSRMIRMLPPVLEMDARTLTQAGIEGSELVLRGKHFTSRADMKITVSDLVVEHFDVIDPETVKALIPPLSAGLHEVTVSTFMGEASSKRGVVAWPALEIVGATGRGLPVDLAIYGKPEDRYSVFMSERLTRQPLEPYGTLFLDPDANFQKLLNGALVNAREEHLGVVPRVEQYHGRVIYLQALVGDREKGEARLTNVLRVRFH